MNKKALLLTSLIMITTIIFGQNKINISNFLSLKSTNNLNYSVNTSFKCKVKKQIIKRSNSPASVIYKICIKNRKNINIQLASCDTTAEYAVALFSPADSEKGEKISIQDSIHIIKILSGAGKANDFYYILIKNFEIHRQTKALQLFIYDKDNEFIENNLPVLIKSFKESYIFESK